MEGVRHRKSGGDMGVVTKGNRTSGTMYSSFRLMRLFFNAILFSLAMLIILVTLNNTWPMKNTGHSTNILDRTLVAMGVQERVYAVIIDAGSTGSRVLAFTFFKSLTVRSRKNLGGGPGDMNMLSMCKMATGRMMRTFRHERKPG